MRFGWSTEVSLFVEGFLFFVFFPIQERVGLETDRSTEGKVGWVMGEGPVKPVTAV